MADLAAQAVVRAGIIPTYAACAGGGDAFVNTGKEVVHIKNGSGGALTVTFTTQNTIDGLAVADRTVSVGAGAEKIIGPFQTSIYNDGTEKVQMTYSGVTSLTIAVIDPDGN